LVLLSAFLAFGLASHVQAQAETVERAEGMREPGEILGGARHSKAKVERYARSKNSTKYIMRTIPIYYKMAPRRNIAPDVLIPRPWSRPATAATAATPTPGTWPA
jgi:hypothetical protein